MNRVREFMQHQGRRNTWLAEHLNISEGMVTRLLDGERTWKPEQKRVVSLLLGVPESALFLSEGVDEGLHIR